MRSQLSPQNHNDDEILKKLLFHAAMIEHHFDAGQATNIRTDVIEDVIQLSLKLRRKTNDQKLIDLLADIENIAYAIMSDYKEARYYALLRRLSQMLRALKDFE